MARTHKKADTKKCTGPCGRTLPREAFPHRKVTLADGTIRYYPRPECNDCFKIRNNTYRRGNRALHDKRRIDRALKGETKQPRGAIKKYRESNSTNGRASTTVPAGAFLSWLTLERKDRGLTQEQLCATLNLDSSVLRRAARSDKIGAHTIDLVCTHLGRPDLAHLFTENT